VLDAYMDASGLHDGSPVVSISGFVADESTWVEFTGAWDAVLHRSSRPSRLTRFHAFDCARYEGEFFDARWSFAERLLLYGDLTEVIRKSAIRPVSSSVITECFSQISPEELELLQRGENRLGTPLDLATHMILQQTSTCARDSGPGQTVNIVFDQDRKEVEEHFLEFVKQYAGGYYLGDIFTAVGFEDSRNVLPLQAADMLNYGTHHVAQMSQALPDYRIPDFPVFPALWNMLVDLARSPSTSPHGLLINTAELKGIVERVKNKQMLPRNAAPAT
jgi:uncharacterized protein DUF3800